MKYLVTTRLEVLKSESFGCQVFMVDGTVPGWSPSDHDHHFDHHKKGGADIQIDEMPNYIDNINPDLQGLVVTTQVDADACVAAACLQVGSKIDQETLNKLRAIAYDCDHLAVPPSLDEYADFASQCVAAMKAKSGELVDMLGLPSDRKSWSLEQKEMYASFAFRHGTESIIAACLGKQLFPGENREAKEYWERVESNTQRIIDEKRILNYKRCLIFDGKGLQGEYIDPRCWIKASQQMGLIAELPITLAQREVIVENEFKGFSYTIGCIPLHTRLSDLDFTQGTFEALTAAERKLNPDADGWGGRKTVGGSGWNTPSRLTPQQVIDIVTTK